ncbi:MAG: hypothetical protein LBD76_06615 [Prevotellaceae bacterium]|jgi:prophage antirepressor-like protein|nr:hypothetical protein [Prevotellaceae bacterium]
MKELVFKHENFGEVRVIEMNGEPMFVAYDVAKALGYSNTRDAVATHCKLGDAPNWDITYIPHSNGVGGTNAIVIDESNMYRLIMKSRLPKAEEFQNWVCEKVLPSYMNYFHKNQNARKYENVKNRYDSES